MTRAIAAHDRRAMRMLLAMLVAATILALPALAAAQEISGTWESRVWDDNRNADGVHLSLRLDRERGRGNWQTGFSTETADLTGISTAELRGTLRDARFELRREAGTVTFEGDVRNGRGTGFFTFTVNPDYVRRMADLGYAGLSRERLFTFASQDVTTAYVRELAAAGYDDLPENDLVKFAIHGVSIDYIRGMNDLGYRDIDADDLVKMRIHGVSLEYVRRVRAALGGS